MPYFSFEFFSFSFVLIVLYYTFFKKKQWQLLLIFSFLYYLICSGIGGFLYLVSIIVISYSAGLLLNKQNIKKNNIDKEDKEEIINVNRRKKLIVSVSVVLELLVLWFVKYCNFTIITTNRVLSLFGINTIPLIENILVPLGISYFILQTIGYICDVYRNKITVETDFFKYSLFVSYFPQIVQGPISCFKDLSKELFDTRKFDYNRVMFGLQRMLWGYIKKVVIADRIALFVNEVYANYADKGYSGLVIFLATVFYGFQVFTDFSGGIDIVIGLSQTLGMELPENFRQPFFASSVSEFWQRWHISLGDWMREYVFYPLALSKSFTKLGKRMRKVFGNNVGKVIAPSIASFIVFLLVGLWHGAAWKYVVYGLYQSIFVSSASLFEKQYNEIKQDFKINEKALSFRLFRILRTNIIINIGRYFTRAESFGKALSMLKTSFSKISIDFLFNDSIFKMGLNKANFTLAIVALVIVLFVEFVHEFNINIRVTIAKQDIVTRWAIYILAIVALLVFGMYGADFNASSFIYQGF